MKQIDIGGQKFGKLTANRPVGSNKCGQTLWECTCDCGNTTIVNVSNLRRGRTRSCGCRRKDNVCDISGQRFGNLIAIEKVANDGTVSNPGRSALWRCRCDCGRETITKSNSLRSGNSKSCGSCSYGTYEFIGSDAVCTTASGEQFIFSQSDYPVVRQHRWWLDKGNGYVTTSVNGSCIHIHRILFADGQVIDHINRDKTDNRRENLRPCNARENAYNKSMPSTNTSGYLGAYWHIRQKKWLSMIKVDGKTRYLGAYPTAEQAALARDRAAVRYFGEFANLNFPEEARLHG